MKLSYLLNRLSHVVGKRYSKASFVETIPEDATILELGPFYNPMCRGSKVKYFEILDQSALAKRAKAIDSNINTDSIPFIDYVSPNGDLSVVEGSFDVVVSSHVIEHQIDLIGHLQKVSRLLNEGGKYYLVIPDKRYCFDHFNPESTIADVLNAHVEKRNKHSLKSVIEHRVLTTHNDARKHWAGEHGTRDNMLNKIKDAVTEYNTQEYIDVHAFYFTPDSFSNIIHQLNELGNIDLAISRLHKTSFHRFEFYCVLEKTKH